MDIKPIKTKADYKAALKEIESVMTAKANTPKEGRLGILVTLVESYAKKHFPLDLPDPVETIKLHMDQMGLTPKDLEPAFSRLNRVYEVLSYKQPLTLKMIWHLHSILGIPAESLIKQPEKFHAV
ncbi:MAG: transcriptional regulator [Gammaproteobacteria bacterium]|nr:MAG: transcriptional regulator [Gammaproteobacteria bacterium]